MIIDKKDMEGKINDVKVAGASIMKAQESPKNAKKYCQSLAN